MMSVPGNRGSTVTEYVVRVPKNGKGRAFHAMKFNSNLNINVTEWTKVNMVREGASKEAKVAEEENPKFGAGSEFGKEAREEARRRKYGGKKKNSEDQPWLMKIGGKGGKKFKGLREGGITENASYFVLMQSRDGSFEAYPVQTWYNFTPIQRFKALTAEEAEEEFGRRNKIMNYFSVMVKKKLQTGDEEERAQNEENEGKKGGKGSKADKSSLKITEMEEWIDSDEESDSDEDDESGKKKDKKKKGDDDEDDKKKAKKQKNKKKKEDVGSEAEEESDDGDEEGRELDYISDSSASEEELERKMDDKGVDEEDAIRKVLDSDEEDEEEEEQKEGEEDGEGGKEEKDSKEGIKKDDLILPGEMSNGKGDKKKKKKVKREASSKGPSRDNSGDSSDISDTEIDLESSMIFDQRKKGKGSNSASESNSRSSSPPAPGAKPRGEKRKAEDIPSSIGQQVVKKLKAEPAEKSSPANNLPAAVLQAATEAGITEEGVTRYLMRKPMTAKELLQKFKSKKHGISSDHLVMLIAQILQRLNLEKRKVRDSLYFSLKA